MTVNATAKEKSVYNSDFAREVIGTEEAFERRCDTRFDRAVTALETSGKMFVCRMCGSSLTSAYVIHNGWECPECAT